MKKMDFIVTGNYDTLKPATNMLIEKMSLKFKSYKLSFGKREIPSPLDMG